MKVGNGNIPLRIGNLINTRVHGGPYRNIPVDMFGVKMAIEIDHPHDVSVPTRDFCVPEVSDLRAGVVRALMAMINGQEVYAGCMGGIGRTGLFLAALAKVQIEYRRSKHRKGRGEDAVGYVRQHFIPHAVETQEQKQYIEDFDVSDIVSWLDSTQRAMGLNVGFQPKSDPAIDHYTADWKQRHVENAQLMELVERDLDWVDEIDADSADDFISSEEDVLDSLQAQIDELTERVDLVEVGTAGTLQHLGARMDSLLESINSLTNQTLSSKVWGIFRK